LAVKWSGRPPFGEVGRIDHLRDRWFASERQQAQGLRFAVNPDDEVILLSQYGPTQDRPNANRLVPCYLVNMTRIEAIAIITSKLADIVQDMAAPTAVALDLTDAERAAIERSKEDFKAGRTYSSTQYHAEMTAFIADLKSKHP
jgi:hypothetical protein